VSDKSSTMWVECNQCEHRWVAVHLPMEMDKVIRVMGHLICPNCAEGISKIYICNAPEPSTKTVYSIGGGGGTGCLGNGGWSAPGEIKAADGSVLL